MLEWNLPATAALDLAGSGSVGRSAADRQTQTAAEVLKRFEEQPGVILADEVGMGKTFVAFAVATGVVASTDGASGPVVIVVPSHMRTKWLDDWQRFLRHCVTDQDLREKLTKRSTHVEDVADLLRTLDDEPHARNLVAFIKITAFTSNLKDKWIKIALVQKAFARNPHLSEQRRAFELWAPHLLMMRTNGVDDRLISDLLDAEPIRWRKIIDAAAIGEPLRDDPIPAALSDRRQEGDLEGMYEFLRQLPSSPNRVGAETSKRQRDAFGQAVHRAFRSMLHSANWSTPLLILDEAHHLKNPKTAAHSLFDAGESSKDGVDFLNGCFQRMMFLTATPFQLGHYELLNVLRLFQAVRWEGADAPPGGRSRVEAMLTKLREALDDSQRSARRLEECWGELTYELVAGEVARAGQVPPANPDALMAEWWRMVSAKPEGSSARSVVELVGQAGRSKAEAEALLKPWVIRHNRPRNFSPSDGGAARRLALPGNAIATANAEDAGSGSASGLSLTGDDLLPFLLGIRAQAEIARCAGSTRAYFAEGLASSYEAFHHTRRQPGHAYDGDEDDAGPEEQVSEMVEHWYRKNIARLVPGKELGDQRSMSHPKVSATVQRAADLWERGEKVLIFCFYIQTARALRLHLSEALEQRMLRRVAAALQLPEPDGRPAAEAAWRTLERVGERCARKGPLHEVLHGFVRQRIEAKFPGERGVWLDGLGQALHRFLRSFSFVARYFPFDNPSFRASVAEDERADAEAKDALDASLKARDASGSTLESRVDAFLDFIHEKWVDQGGGEPRDETDLKRYLAAFESMQFRSKAGFRAEDENFERVGGRRVLANVRVATGDGMDASQRETVMRAFNSPMFPEILVASQVLAEGVDLHRACRYVIHHDLCWNPSTLEQRVGRVDRIGSKSEQAKEPIHIYEPFLSATADEKMFRVVKDRERWFQVVMGDQFKLGEASTEKLLHRLPLPESIARDLSFDLAVCR